MEENLVHGEGDHEGEPFRLAPHGRRVIYRWYEYDPLIIDGEVLVDPVTHLAAHGAYRYQKGLIGWPKGQSKTELEAAIGVEHLEGPAPKLGTPVVDVAAVDGDQAEELVRIAAQLVKGQPLEELLRIDSSKILQRHGEGRMRATTAAGGKNDGKKTSLLLTDELHEWDRHSGDGKKRYQRLGRSVNKRSFGRELNVTTAGWNLDTLAGGLYEYGCKVASGELVDPGFLFEWWQASDGWDLDDPEQLEAAIREANPAVGLWLSIDKLVRSYHEHKLLGETNDFIRYHLNRWIGVLEDAWMDMAIWAARADGIVPPAKGTPLVLGFDGSLNGDSTALVGATVSMRPHLFVVGLWENVDDVRGWSVPIDEVEQRIAWACRHWKVLEVPADASYWRGSLDRLANAGLPIAEVPQSPKRLGPACERLLEATATGAVTHDGDPRFTRHVGNCRRVQTEFGTRVAKEHKHSKRRIDLALAGIFAHERAVWHAANTLIKAASATPPKQSSASSLYRPTSRLAI